VSYLLKRNRLYYFRVVVPLDLQEYLGCKEIKRSLHCTKKTEARQLAVSMVSGIFTTFQEIRRIQLPMSQPQPSKEAIQIWLKRNPECKPLQLNHRNIALNLGMAGVPLIPEYHPDIMTIQQLLDMGYLPDASGNFDLMKPPQFDMSLPQTPVALPVVSTSIGEPSKKPLKIVTLKEAISSYMEHRNEPESLLFTRKVSKSTLEGDTTALNRLGQWVGNDITPIQEVSERNFNEFSEWLQEKHKNQPSSINTRIIALQGFFGWLEEQKWITEVPKFKRAVEQSGTNKSNSNRPYSDEELQKIFNVIAKTRRTRRMDREASLRLAYFLLVLLYTGMRRSEVENLSLDSVGTVKKVLAFSQTQVTKNKDYSVRYIPVHCMLNQLGLNDYIKAVASNPSGNIFDEKTIYNNFKMLLNKLKINEKYGTTFHSFRSLFNSKLMAVMPDSMRNKMLGHKGKGMDKHYIYCLISDLPQYSNYINQIEYDVDFMALETYLKRETERLYG